MKLLWKKATGNTLVKTQRQDNDKKDLIESLKSLTNILHAFSDGLSLGTDLNRFSNHLVETDVTVIVAIDHEECLLSLILSFDNDGMGRVGVEDLLTSDLRGEITEDGSDLVSNLANFSDELHGSGRAISLVTLLTTKHHLNAIVDDGVFIGEFLAVQREESARGIEEKTEEMNLSLGLLDTIGE
ncbi:hypothetical protein HG531_001893 [Fusarium graminearum]|nr:hypothetical protein HG531_001893 [Fusarium graminearum]